MWMCLTTSWGNTVVEGLQLNTTLDACLDKLHLDQARQPAQQPEKKLRFARVTDAAPMQAMLHDAGYG